MTTATSTRPTDGSHLPVIHLNGSGKQALLDQYEAAVVALNAALDALAGMSPHGRDYYPNGDTAYFAARAEFERRVALVMQVRDDVRADWFDVASRD